MWEFDVVFTIPSKAEAECARWLAQHPHGLIYRGLGRWAAHGDPDETPLFKTREVLRVVRRHIAFLKSRGKIRSLTEEGRSVGERCQIAPLLGPRQIGQTGWRLLQCGIMFGFNLWDPGLLSRFDRSQYLEELEVVADFAEDRTEPGPLPLSLWNPRRPKSMKLGPRPFMLDSMTGGVFLPMSVTDIVLFAAKYMEEKRARAVKRVRVAVQMMEERHANQQNRRQ